MNRTSPWMLAVVATLLCLLGLASADDASAQRDFDSANSLFREKQFAKALAIYDRLASEGFGTREVLANAGDAAYRLGDTGQAVLHYRRALRVDPSYRRARENMLAVQPSENLAKEQGVGDAIGEWFRGTPGWPWLVAAEVAYLWLMIAAVLLIRASDGEARGRRWSGVAYAAVLLAFSAGLVALHGHVNALRNEAVVMRKGTIARSGPGANYFETLELPAGTVIELTEAPQIGWVRFRLLDGRGGYLQTYAVEGV